MKKTWFTSGEWNALCDVCGVKRKNIEMKDRWDGLMVCSPAVKQGCWETRHPQEFIRPIPDQQKLPWTRPEPTDTFITVDYNVVANQCSVVGVYSQADYGEADCAIVGMVNGSLVPLESV